MAPDWRGMSRRGLLPSRITPHHNKGHTRLHTIAPRWFWTSFYHTEPLEQKTKRTCISHNEREERFESGSKSPGGREERSNERLGPAVRGRGSLWKVPFSFFFAPYPDRGGQGDGLSLPFLHNVKSGDFFFWSRTKVVVVQYVCDGEQRGRGPKKKKEDTPYDDPPGSDEREGKERNDRDR